MQKKIRVGILFGGKSAEHEVSLQSARNIIDSIDKDKYEVVLIGIDKQGRWHLNETSRYLLNADNPKLIKLNTNPSHLALVPGNQSHQLIDIATSEPTGKVDVVFPIMHGPYGEDGSIQGLLKLAEVPFVGAGVLGSAVGMDKDVMKRLLKEAGLPTAKFLVFQSSARKAIRFDEVAAQLGLPFFVKPANLGSSVGIHRIVNASEFERAIDDAFLYDRKILIEENIAGREIECSVLGNAEPIASLPGEIIANAEHHTFYSYEAKYIDESGATLEIPANLDQDTIRRIQEIAIEVFRVLCCEGMARIDFFLKKNGEIVVNELNTIPGFTRISMYPKLWQASGISYTELIDRLIQLAIDRFKTEQALRTSYES